jgi:riboflavin biosynthesis pyrimidine reductase
VAANSSLAKLGVIDEIILDVEPITLGSGKRLFGSHDIQLSLELLRSQKIGNGTIQNHYKVQK